MRHNVAIRRSFAAATGLAALLLVLSCACLVASAAAVDGAQSAEAVNPVAAQLEEDVGISAGLQSYKAATDEAEDDMAQAAGGYKHHDGHHKRHHHKHHSEHHHYKHDSGDEYPESHDGKHYYKDPDSHDSKHYKKGHEQPYPNKPEDDAVGPCGGYAYGYKYCE